MTTGVAKITNQDVLKWTAMLSHIKIVLIARDPSGTHSYSIISKKHREGGYINWNPLTGEFYAHKVVYYA